MPYIKVNPSALASISETLRKNSTKVGQIESDFSRIANRLDWDVRSASDIQKRMTEISRTLDTQANRLQKMQAFIVDSMGKYGSVASSVGAVVSGENTSSGSNASGLIDWVLQYFDIKKLGIKAVGCFGPVGTMVAAVLNGVVEKDPIKSAKDISKLLNSYFKFADKTKLSNYLKTNRFGGNYGTKNYLKRLFGLNRQNSGLKGSLINRMGQVGVKFREGIRNTFITTDPNTGATKANKWGIIGVGIDFVFNGIGNLKQYQAGEISASRAVVETVAETGTNLVISAGATAVATVLLPATAPAVAVAVTSAAVVWAADGLTKLITGGDKGLGEVVSEGVGWVWDKGCEAAKNAWDKGKEAGKKALEKGAKFFDQIRSKVIGNSNAYCGSW